MKGKRKQKCLLFVRYIPHVTRIKNGLMSEQNLRNADV